MTLLCIRFIDRPTNSTLTIKWDTWEQWEKNFDNKLNFDTIMWRIKYVNKKKPVNS